MKKAVFKILMFLFVFIAFIFILFSYFFSGSRAGTLTSNEEYMNSIRALSRNKELPGEEKNEIQPNKETQNQAEEPKNIMEELILKIKNIFRIN